MTTVNVVAVNMVAVNVIAVLGLAFAIAMYFLISSFLRGQLVTTGKAPDSKRGGRKGTKGKNAPKRGRQAAVRQEVYVPSPQDKKIGLTVFVAVMAVAFLARVIAAALYKGHDTDMNCFLLWGDMVYKDGFKAFYASESFTDYPPGYMYILFVIGWIRSVTGLAWDSVTSIVLTKLPAILSDLGIGYLIYRAAGKKFRETGAALLAAVYLFCPAVFLDSAVWGQTDAVFTLFVVLMCYLVTEKKLIPAYFVFAAAILIKPQSLIFTPVLIYGIIDQVILEEFSWKRFGINLGLGLLAIAMIGLLMMPYGFMAALSQYKDTVGSYEYASVNAYNFWSLIGMNWTSQDEVRMGLKAQTWGTIFILLTVAWSAWISFRCKKTKSKYFFTGGLIVTCVFLFSVRMHERYIFPALVLFLMAFALRPRKEIYFLHGFFGFFSFYNMAHVLFFYDPQNYDRSDPVRYAISGLGMLCFGYLIYTAVRLYNKYMEENAETEAQLNSSSVLAEISRIRQEEKEKSFIRPSSVLARMTKKDYIAMGVITAVYAVVAFVNLGNLTAPQTEYSVVKQGAVTVDFGEEKTLAKVADYLGYQHNPKYYVDYSDDGTNWNPLFGADNPLDAGSVFCWNYNDLNITARYVRITQSADTGNDSIMELVFTDADGNVLTPVNAEDYHALFDEQDLYVSRASNMDGTYFDEIYHGRTAYEMIHKLYCYENTHPPLGKELIALGILIFGMCPFGWRFVGTLCGVFMVPIIYNFAKKFFKETWISIITTILFSFDFMHFVQTRISTIDVYVTMFIMLSYYFMYCYTRLSFFDTKLSKTWIPLAFCGTAMGLSWAAKWTGIYSSAGLAIIFFAQMIRRFREYIYATKHPDQVTEGIKHSEVISTFYRKLILTLLMCCVFFILIPACIYLLSYIPFNDGTDRTFLVKVIEAQKTMYNYHSNLDATHPYGSKWYQWPIMYRPVWYYSSVIDDTWREGISAFGNPLVWWAGIPAFIFMLVLIFVKKDRKAAFLSVGYLSQYAPWIGVTRVVFMYHYFPSVPFITVMVGYSMYLIVKRYPKVKPVMFVYAAAAVGLFAMFYPVLSGTPVTIHYAETYLKWFDNWVLVQTW